MILDVVIILYYHLRKLGPTLLDASMFQVPLLFTTSPPPSPCIPHKHRPLSSTSPIPCNLSRREGTQGTRGIEAIVPGRKELTYDSTWTLKSLLCSVPPDVSAAARSVVMEMSSTQNILSKSWCTTKVTGKSYSLSLKFASTWWNEEDATSALNMCFLALLGTIDLFKVPNNVALVSC